MLAPKIWLQKYVDLTGISDQNFADKMTFAGNKVEAIHQQAGQTVYELEITSNRPDTLSIIGLAREAAAVFGRKFTPPQVPTLKNISAKPKTLTIANKDYCSTYACVEIAGVNVKPSSRQIQQLLTLAGHRPVNNIVDITNFMLWEHAQLMHTFDADKINGNLKLRLAKPGEKVIPLDHKERNLLGGEIIIEDEKEIIDVPGLMGGLNTEITNQTKRVYLLVAIDNPILVRRASKNLKLRSASSTRSEKKLDLTQCEAVAKRVVAMIEAESGGKQATKLITSTSSYLTPTIKLSLDQVKKVLGITVTQAQVDQIFKSLEIKSTPKGYQPPAWRRDLEKPVDLIEEIARLVGYNQMPKTLPSGNIPVHQTALKTNWVRKIKNITAALGFNETYSSTLVSLALIDSLSLDIYHHLKVLHPMSIDFEYMRSTILESLIPLLGSNLAHTDQINLFELGTVFLPAAEKQLPDQPLELGLLSTTADFASLKGKIFAIIGATNQSAILRPSSHPHPTLHPSNQAQIMINKTPVGFIGQLPDKKAWVATLNITALIANASLEHSYPQLSSFPAIVEDLTFTLPQNTYLGPIISAIYQTSPLIIDVKLTKTYQHNYTFKLIYQSLVKQISDVQVSPLRKTIVSRLAKDFKAKLVGKI